MCCMIRHQRLPLIRYSHINCCALWKILKAMTGYCSHLRPFIIIYISFQQCIFLLWALLRRACKRIRVMACENYVPCWISATALMKPSELVLGNRLFSYFCLNLRLCYWSDAGSSIWRQFPLFVVAKSDCCAHSVVRIIKSNSSQAFSISFMFQKSSIRAAFQVFWYYQQTATI